MANDSAMARRGDYVWFLSFGGYFYCGVIEIGLKCAVWSVLNGLVLMAWCFWVVEELDE